MNYIFISVANFILGLFGSLPTHQIQVDLTSLQNILSYINYFIPFYLIAPILSIWFGFIGILIAGIGIWGYIKRNF